MPGSEFDILMPFCRGGAKVNKCEKIKVLEM
jgi:hypothetical protein